MADARSQYEAQRDYALGMLPQFARNPVLVSGLTCHVCAGPLNVGEALCLQCDRQRSQYPGLLATLVVPLAYAGSRNPQLKYALSAYKNSGEAGVPLRNQLAFLVWYSVIHHGNCVEKVVGAPVAAVASVPSGRMRPGPHPLESFSYFPSAPRRVHLLRVGQPVERQLSPETLELTGDVSGGHVVLFDDTWASGASAQAAAIVLRRAGAAHVTIVAVGRWLNEGWSPTARFYRELPDSPWVPSICPVSRGPCP